jgi:hypothetical protein
VLAHKVDALLGVVHLAVREDEQLARVALLGLSAQRLLQRLQDVSSAQVGAQALHMVRRNLQIPVRTAHTTHHDVVQRQHYRTPHIGQDTGCAHLSLYSTLPWPNR